MSAACAYAREPEAPQEGAGGAMLADVFCRQARRRVAAAFRAARDRGGRRENALASRVLDREMRWLERGIIPVTAQPESASDAGDGADPSAPPR
jgi:hypothetical protein